MTTTKTHTIDTKKPPRLSDAVKARYDATREDQIDYSDIPDMGDVDWSRAARKATVTMRLDADVIDFFKRDQPKGYTGRMAAVLSAFARQYRDKDQDR